MKLEGLSRVLAGHPFASGLTDEHLATLVGCAKNLRLAAGEWLTPEGDPQGDVLLIRRGELCLETPHATGHGRILETFADGSVLDLSRQDDLAARAVGRARVASVALALDGPCLRRRMDRDPVFGYAISRQLLVHAQLRIRRLRSVMAQTGPTD